ncbi:MAG: hypothetical protein IPK60_25405 [Sandaracinaceae bacterium]|nr:hypothetical protein [Sandaracinaceae bacterium]
MLFVFRSYRRGTALYIPRWWLLIPVYVIGFQMLMVASPLFASIVPGLMNMPYSELRALM